MAAQRPANTGNYSWPSLPLPSQTCDRCGLGLDKCIHNEHPVLSTLPLTAGAFPRAAQDKPLQDRQVAISKKNSSLKASQRPSEATRLKSELIEFVCGMDIPPGMAEVFRRTNVTTVLSHAFSKLQYHMTDAYEMVGGMPSGNLDDRAKRKRPAPEIRDDHEECASKRAKDAATGDQLVKMDELTADDLASIAADTTVCTHEDAEAFANLWDHPNPTIRDVPLNILLLCRIPDQARKTIAPAPLEAWSFVEHPALPGVLFPVDPVANNEKLVRDLVNKLVEAISRKDSFALLSAIDAIREAISGAVVARPVNQILVKRKGASSGWCNEKEMLEGMFDPSLDFLADNIEKLKWLAKRMLWNLEQSSRTATSSSNASLNNQHTYTGFAYQLVKTFASQTNRDAYVKLTRIYLEHLASGRGDKAYQLLESLQVDRA
ncbi:hypothetical protein [Parendozoicomonas haliclonae]|uniref:Uncharacterized protein n=1 Tax=Parendozoicomonas haliclonae TaxID=1960125 RepID=A0A1X7AGD6_9GAMM|nr:hypothetical protein [Parendozoicomonas haliclonae]SMA38552.1 hypothetical protein EHSB41UT_00890 [Parendozoicomonas haliclonae]